MTEMDCAKCQERISDYIDGALTAKDRSLFNAHLEHCAVCSGVTDELNVIVSFSQELRGQYEAPPNQRALWLRIRNTIEADNGLGRSRVAGSVNAKRLAQWWAMMSNRSWEVSFRQMSAAVAALVVIVALSTAVGIRRFSSTSELSDQTANSRPTANMGVRPATDIDDRVRQHQIAIDYWNNRVELQKARWNPVVREAFERNMFVIDQTLKDSIRDLRENPHDEVSEEMLNATLKDKMDLLKEFSDQ